MAEFWNETTQILLPGFGFKGNDIETLNLLVNHGLINAYLCPQYKLKDDLYLKFHPKKVNGDFLAFYNTIKKFNIYKHTLFSPNGDITIIIGYPPSKYTSIYLPFVNDKWDQIDKTYRSQRFCKNYMYKGELKINRRWDILNTDKVKDPPKLDLNIELYK